MTTPPFFLAQTGFFCYTVLYKQDRLTAGLAFLFVKIRQRTPVGLHIDFMRIIFMNDLTLLMYLEIDILCITVLLFIIFRSFRSMERRESWRFYQHALYSVTLFIGCDILWKLMDSHILTYSHLSIYLVNSLYYIFAAASTAFWFFYTESELNTNPTRARTIILFTSTPMVVIALLLVTSYYNGCLFSFDAEGHFQRGPLNLILFAIPCCYLVTAAAHALYKAFKKENYANRKHYLNLARFALTPTICCALQIFVPGTPLPSIGIAAGMLLVYVTTQELLVSLDPLTKLNNRYRMIHYLTDKMEHANHFNHLFLLIIDLDNFKLINDNFGHVEGDHALIRLASVLRQAGKEFNCFVSRYGGDEFIIVFESQDPSDIRRLCVYIHDKLEEMNRAAGKSYLLHASIRYAQYNEEIRYVPEFISQADKSLYEIKKSKRCSASA